MDRCTPATVTEESISQLLSAQGVICRHRKQDSLGVLLVPEGGTYGIPFNWASERMNEATVIMRIVSAIRGAIQDTMEFDRERFWECFQTDQGDSA